MSESREFSRRRFLKGVGVGAVAAGAVPGLENEAGAKAAKAKRTPNVHGPDAMEIALDVNGEARRVTVEPRVTLLDALRNHLDLTGAKKVCDRATCGACTVLVDGKPIYGCTMLAVAAQGKKIETVESLASDGELTAIQSAFVKNDAQQCGFCTPGFVVACESFLRTNDDPTREQVCEGLGGNLCRCGTYVGIKAAVVDAARAKRGGGR